VRVVAPNEPGSLALRITLVQEAVAWFMMKSNTFLELPATVSVAAEDTTKVITDQENEWVAAIVKKNTGKIDRLLADDFSGTTDDQIYSKADAIEDVKSGTHESLDLDNIKVRLFGDTAVVTMSQNEKSRHGNTDFTGHYLFT